MACVRQSVYSSPLTTADLLVEGEGVDEEEEELKWRRGSNQNVRFGDWVAVKETLIDYKDNQIK